MPISIQSIEEQHTKREQQCIVFSLRVDRLGQEPFVITGAVVSTKRDDEQWAVPTVAFQNHEPLSKDEYVAVTACVYEAFKKFKQRFGGERTYMRRNAWTMMVISFQAYARASLVTRCRVNVAVVVCLILQSVIQWWLK